MPHAVDDHPADDQDDEDIKRLLGGETLGDLGDLENRDLDLGEKASDAEDFEDIGNDDLVDDDEELDAKTGKAEQHHDPTQTALAQDEEEDDEHDDLFNARDDVFSPVAEQHTLNGLNKAALPVTDQKAKSPASEEDDLFEDDTDQPETTQVDDQSDDQEDPEFLEQRALFEQSKRGYIARLKSGDNSFELPPAPQTNAEIFDTIWPTFEPHKPLRFGELLPGKRAYYLTKQPLKPPKPVQPTKINLDLAPDQEKGFRLPGPAESSLSVRRAEAEAKGLVLTQDQEFEQQDSDEEMYNVEDDETAVGGVKWQDFVAVCQDWTIPSPSLSDSEDPKPSPRKHSFDDSDLFEEDRTVPDTLDQSTKMRPLDGRANPFPLIYNIDFSWDDPEAATARLAKRIKLDLNDPHMLVDLQSQPAPGRQKNKVGGNFKRDAIGGLSRDFARRYNISNDEAYDLLKENRQSKVRSNLGNMAVDHSLPAIKLQYPFYKVKLTEKEARSFHRPKLVIDQNRCFFSKPAFIKRKHTRGKTTHELFHKSEDLTQGDNSNMLLLEYSEEYPSMMSNFGMNQRLVNHYRRKDDQDVSRPRLDIGETDVLLPQDKSPFSIFGDVEPGEMTSAIRNAMYRAPVFKHEANKRDFLLISNRTSVQGRRWYLKNLANLHVVGQQFPSVEVPGTNSRKVTDASKKRLRMLAYRVLRRHKRLKNETILDHFPGSDIPQNRGKMKEFMDYDKDRGWVMKPNDSLPEEEFIRGLLKPEELCLLEAMQVGDRHLQDAGYNKSIDDTDDEEDEEGNISQSIDQQLAPWHTTKNFLNACQEKAMIQLHGEGDPSGRGEAFSFMKISMKGGFREPGESVASRLDAKRLKEKGGHNYSVAEQRSKYAKTITKIWNAQRTSLSSTADHADSDMEDIHDDSFSGQQSRARTPSSAFAKSRRDDETGSVFSRTSAGSQMGKVLRITRRSKDKYGTPTEVQTVIQDPKVIRAYMKKRQELELSSLTFADMKRTGDQETDQKKKAMIAAEIERLERNKKRSGARGKGNAASPDSGASGDDGGDSAPPSASKGKKNQGGGTKRRCAACGQVGHIKTNKQACPMQNGTQKVDEGFGSSAFGAITAPTPSGGQGPSTNPTNAQSPGTGV